MPTPNDMPGATPPDYEKSALEALHKGDHQTALIYATLFQADRTDFLAEIIETQCNKHSSNHPA